MNIIGDINDVDNSMGNGNIQVASQQRGGKSDYDYGNDNHSFGEYGNSAFNLNEKNTKDNNNGNNKNRKNKDSNSSSGKLTNLSRFEKGGSQNVPDRNNSSKNVLSKNNAKQEKDKNWQKRLG